MRELVKRLAGDNANRHQLLDSLRSNVQQQRDDAALALREMGSARVQMSAELHAGLADDLTNLRDAVQAMLGDFEAGRQTMKADLQADLMATRQERQQDVSMLHANARQFVGEVAETRQAMAAALSAWLADNHVELHASVQDMLGSFADERASISENMRRTLAAESAARRQDVANMVATIEAMLDRFAAENQAAATELHQVLDANTAQRQQTVASLLAHIRALLQQLAAENRTAALELQAFLTADRTARDSTMAAFMADIVAQRHAMTNELAAGLDQFVTSLSVAVSATLANFSNERHALHASLAEMAAIWGAYAANLQEPEMQEPEVAAMPQPVAEAEPAPASGSEVGALPAEVDVIARILNFLASKPEGAKLVELEPELGLSRPQIGKHLRGLVDSGKIVKDPETLFYTLA